MPDRVQPAADRDGAGWADATTIIAPLLERASAARRRLTLADIDAVSPAGPSVAIARLAMAMLSDAPEEDALEAACVRAVAGAERWLELLAEMLTNLPPTPAVCRAILAILAERLPDHPAALFAGNRGLAIVRAYDAVDDGERIRIDLGAADAIGDGRVGCLLSIEEPATLFARCAIVERRARTIWVTAERDGPLFAEKRHVLPPAVLVIAEG